MVWAFIERELENSRRSIKTIDELKRKVIYIWNCTPKKLCRNIVKRFDHLVKDVKINNGNKENVKDRRDRRPKFILKDRLGWTNKIYEQYSDTIERIAYNENTFQDFKRKYKIFINREIAFFKKIKVAIGK